MEKHKLSIVSIFVWMACCAIAFSISKLLFISDAEQAAELASWEVAQEAVTEVLIDLAMGTSLAGIIFGISQVVRKSSPVPYPGVWLWYLAAGMCLLGNSLDALELLTFGEEVVIGTEILKEGESGLAPIEHAETEFIPGPLDESAYHAIRILSHWAMVPVYWLPLLFCVLARQNRPPTQWIAAYAVFAMVVAFGAILETSGLRFVYPHAASALIWVIACCLFGCVYLIDLLTGLKVSWPHFAAVAILLPAAIARAWWAIYMSQL